MIIYYCHFLKALLKFFLGIEKLGGTVNTLDDGSTMSSILSRSNCPKSEGRISLLTNFDLSCHLLSPLEIRNLKPANWITNAESL